MKIPMWKILLTMWITVGASSVLAEQAFKCGQYELTGVIRKVEGQNVMKLYEGSMSEAILTLAPDLSELAEVYLDRSVTLKGILKAPVKNYRGFIESTLTPAEIKDLMSPNKPYTARFMRDDIKERVPDPLHPDLDSGMKLIKERPCGGRNPSAIKK